MNDAIADVLPSYLYWLGTFTLAAMLLGLSAAFLERRLRQSFTLGSLYPARMRFIVISALLAYGLTQLFLTQANQVLYLRTQAFFSNYSVVDMFIRESGYGAQYLDSLDQSPDSKISEIQLSERKQKYLQAFQGLSADGTYGESEANRALRKELISQFIEKPTEIALSSNMSLFGPLLKAKGDDPCPGPTGQFQNMVAEYVTGTLADCQRLGPLHVYLSHVLLPGDNGNYYQATPIQVFRGLRTNKQWDLPELSQLPEADIAFTQRTLETLEKKLSADREKGTMLQEAMVTYIRKLQDAVYPYMRMQKMINGEVQIVTFALYFFGMMILAVRLAYLYPYSLFPDLAGFTQGIGSEDKDNIKLYLERVINGSIGFVMWALPSVGFIGTVVGISLALGDADSVVTAKGAAEQSDAINQVTSLLSVAFDTTLIALVCSIPVFACSYWAESKEAKILAQGDN